MVEENSSIEVIQPFEWDITQMTENLASGISIGAYGVLFLGLMGFVLSKIIKLAMGRP